MNDIKSLTIYNVNTDNRSLENEILICCNRSCEYEYDSKARWYYPAIIRTTTMDPLCEKYYSNSPYAWCNNNPVNLVDPDGKYFTKYHLMKATRYVNFLCKKYNKTETIADKENIARLIRGIGDMEKDTENEYRFLWNPFKESETRGHGLNKEGKVILEMIYSHETKPHEITHGGQNAQGKIQCNEDGTVEGYDLGDEEEAYQNQISVNGAFELLIYDEKSGIALSQKFENEGDITQEIIKNINDNPLGESRPYKDLPNAQ